MEAVACDRGQGFYFSEPVSPEAIAEAYLASRTGEPWAALRDSPAAKRVA